VLQMVQSMISSYQNLYVLTAARNAGYYATSMFELRLRYASIILRTNVIFFQW